jgi:PAS domain S-box-containing protein
LLLLDLGLPDSQGLETFQKAHSHATNVPIIILSGRDDRSLAEDAVKEGAQDYLLKGNLTSEMLLRSVMYARARHRTQRKLYRALRSAQGAEANLRNVILDNIDGMIVVDQQGFVKFSNTAAQRMLGSSADELRASAFGFPAVSDKTIELELCRPGGEQIAAEMRVITVEWEGEACCLAVLRDLTERKQAEEELRASEERFRSITESAHDAIILADDTANIISWNPAAQNIFGYSDQEVLGKPTTTLMPARYREPHTKGFERYAKTGESRVIGRPIELVGLRKGGSEFPLELSLSTWTTTAGQLYCGIIRDVTERKEAEKEHLKRLHAEREISIASRVQQGLFPTRSPSLDGFDIAGAVYPADRASGDYFDFIAMPQDALGVVVADVSGHGLGPAMLMVQTRAYLRALARGHDDLGEILTRTNELLLPNDHGRFISMFFGRIDPRTRSFMFASAGHPAYLLKRSGDVTLLDGTSPVLGVLEDSPVTSSPAIALEAGDLILLMTDGIPESRDADRTLFDVPRTLDVVRANRDNSASDIVDALYQSARDFAQGRSQDDDMTAVVIKVQ